MRNSESSLDSILASRAFSSSSHLVRCSISNTGLQFNLANQRRQRGKVKRYSDLLIHRNGSDAGDVDIIGVSLLPTGFIAADQLVSR